MGKSWCVALPLVLLLTAASPRADEQADALVLVDKAIKTMGGEEKMAKFNAAISKGKGTLDVGAEVSFTEEGSTQFFDRYHFELDLDIQGAKLKQIVVVDGDKGWIRIGAETQEMPKETLGAFKDYFYAFGLVAKPLLLKEKGYSLAPLGEIKVGDRPAVGIRVSHAGRREVSIYFDKETGLPAKAETNAPALEGGQDLPHEFLFSEYKEFDGIQMPTKMLWNRSGKKYAERELSEIKLQEKIDDSAFEKPT